MPIYISLWCFFFPPTKSKTGVITEAQIQNCKKMNLSSSSCVFFFSCFVNFLFTLIFLAQEKKKNLFECGQGNVTFLIGFYRPFVGFVLLGNRKHFNGKYILGTFRDVLSLEL